MLPTSATEQRQGTGGGTGSLRMATPERPNALPLIPAELLHNVEFILCSLLSDDNSLVNDSRDDRPILPACRYAGFNRL